MKIYLVGGAVRDQLLGRVIKERDWVVVGATPRILLDLNYLPVGKDFPVFLHPQTHEEYALARTERKTAPGYKGFVFHADQNVTLEEDLLRRDLTINAMAQDDDGRIIDPFHGQQDLKDRLFRHVSSAFAEDPVRILRIARFAATFPDFNIHPDTQALMREMVQKGEVNALVPERVWQEWEKAFKEVAPHRFFEVLENCDALQILFPVLQFNQLGSDAIRRAARVTKKIAIRLAVFLYALDEKSIAELSEKYRLPGDYRDLARLVSKYHSVYTSIPDLNSEELLNLLESLDAFRRRKRFNDFLEACQIIYQINNKVASKVKKTLALAQSVDIHAFVKQGLKGVEIKEAIHKARVKLIQQG